MRHPTPIRSTLATILLLSLLLAVASGCGRDGVVRPLAESDKTVAAETAAIPFRNDYLAARQAAREQGKPLLLFFFAPNCPFSTQMLDETFRDQAICRASDRFVCVRIDSSVETDLCREFHIKGFPTIQFMSPQGVMLKRITGKQSSSQLAVQMDAAIQSIAQKTDKTVRK